MEEGDYVCNIIDIGDFVCYLSEFSIGGWWIG